MRSRTTATFRKQRNSLPAALQRLSDKAYQQFRLDLSHPGLQFKKVHATLPIYSARIDLDYRAVGTLNGDLIIWFWIGPHSQYERLLKSF